MIFQFLTDEDFNRKILQGLRARMPTLEFKRIQDVGLRTRADEDILEWAAQREYLILSHDVTTMPGHARDRVLAGLPMPGLFVMAQQISVRLAIDEIEIVALCSEPEEWADRDAMIPLRPS